LQLRLSYRYWFSHRLAAKLPSSVLAVFLRFGGRAIFSRLLLTSDIFIFSELPVNSKIWTDRNEASLQKIIKTNFKKISWPWDARGMCVCNPGHEHPFCY
jgi:hypothetical protein